MRITASCPKSKGKATVQIDVPVSVEEMIKKYGERAVVMMVQERIRVIAQNRMRSMLSRGRTPEEIEQSFEHWIPLTDPRARTRRKSHNSWRREEEDGT